MSAYAMVASGSVNASEIERADAEVVDVMFSWGSNVLEVKHLEAGEELTVGEEGCDLLVPSAVLGASSAKILRREGDKVILVPPPGAGFKMNGWARSEASLELQAGHAAEILIGEFSIRFGVVAAPKSVPAAPLTSALTNDGFKSVLGSAFLHAALIASVALFMPKMNTTDNDDIDRDRLVMLQKMLNVSAQKELEREQEQAKGAGSESGGDTKQGEQAKGSPGTAGKTEPVPTNGKMGVKGDAKPQDATMAREADKQLAASFGLIGVLNSATDPNAPVVPWGTIQNGADSKSAIGSMFGQTIDDASGTGGLNLWGTDEGGGGKADYIGLNGFNGLGGPGKCAPGEKCDGIGFRKGLTQTGYTPKGPGPMRVTNFSTNGRLDPIVIQRIIQQNSGRFRQCYMMGLTRNPNLEGHVGVKFVIDRSGAVSTAVDAGSSIPDSAVSACVVRSFTSLSFPAPEGGLVTVQYGFAFSPGQ